MINSLIFLKQSAIAVTLAFMVPFLIHNGIKSIYCPPVLYKETTQITEKEESSTALSPEFQIYYTRFFLVEAIASCVFLAIGFATSIDYLAAGWIFGGFLTLLKSTLWNFQYISSSVLFIILLAFILLITFASHYSEKQKKY